MNMTVGNKLYLLRSRLNLSVEQAADIIGVSKSTLCRYEKDEFCCRNEEVWQRICRLYQVPYTYFREESPASAKKQEIWNEEQLLASWRAADLRNKHRVMRVLARAQAEQEIWEEQPAGFPGNLLDECAGNDV